jgi:LmbE family N-acetylglucosaminyl deacetylase
MKRNGSLFFLFSLMVAWVFPSVSTAQSPFDNNLFLIAGKILIIAPHPDDEILGFAGIIYDAIQQKKEVHVVIVTNGDGYGSACYFWKNGIPREDTSFHGDGCSPSELEFYGLTRIAESKKALAVLGLDSNKVTVLGYPDGWVGEMLRNPDSVYAGNTSRRLSFAGKPFTARNLTEELKNLLRSQAGAELYTVHIRDSHDDHASLAAFIQDARSALVKEQLGFQLWYAMIHEPGGDNNLWPNPVCNWDIDRGNWMVSRERRFTPWEGLQSPRTIQDIPEMYFMQEPLWSENEKKRSLMRLAMDQFETGIGTTRSDGSPVAVGYEGWMDRNGYLISFIKRNHLFWRANDPLITDSMMGACKKVCIVISQGVKVQGISASGMEGECGCQSEIFPAEGIRVGSGFGGGRVWFDAGPVFQDSVMVTLVWADNSWRSDSKKLEIYDWKNKRWDLVTEMTGNDTGFKTLHRSVKLQPEQYGPMQKVRIGFRAGKNARSHLRSIEVE